MRREIVLIPILIVLLSMCFAGTANAQYSSVLVEEETAAADNNVCELEYGTHAMTSTAVKYTKSGQNCTFNTIACTVFDSTNNILSFTDDIRSSAEITVTAEFSADIVDTMQVTLGNQTVTSASPVTISNVPTGNLAFGLVVNLVNSTIWQTIKSINSLDIALTISTSGTVYKATLTDSMTPITISRSMSSAAEVVSAIADANEDTVHTDENGTYYEDEDGNKYYFEIVGNTNTIRIDGSGSNNITRWGGTFDVELNIPAGVEFCVYVNKGTTIGLSWSSITATMTIGGTSYTGNMGAGDSGIRYLHVEDGAMQISTNISGYTVSNDGNIGFKIEGERAVATLEVRLVLRSDIG